MNPRLWLTFATLAALQLSVLASTPHKHRHPNHKHIRIVIKGVADDATPPASDATDVGVSVTYTGANTAPADASSGETAAPYVTVLDNPVTAPPAQVPNVVEDPAAGPVATPPAPLSSAEDPTAAPPAIGLADPAIYPVTTPPAPGVVMDPVTAPPAPVIGAEDPATAPPVATAPEPDAAALTSAPVDTAPPVAVIATAPPSSNALPVFFFHGVTSNSKSGFNFNANLTQEGRAFVALDFCQDLCSVSSLNTQVPMAIQQIRSTVANDARFDHGYIFIGHSQGASIARAVVEEMDDHKVRMLISLAGPQNGIFYGPQPSDVIPTQAFAGRVGPRTIPASIFNFSNYAPADYASGKFQSDINDLVFNYPALQDKISVLNLARSPVKREWRKANTFLPVVNNINPCDGNDTATCEAAKKQRRDNFLKLTSAHFFGSPADDLIAPWQTSLLGQYTDVAKEQDLVPNFPLLEPIGMKFTEEYQSDTYGLKSLDQRDGLFLYEVADVGHSCWVADSVPLGKTGKCLWKPIYEDYIYPLLHTPGWGLV